MNDLVVDVPPLRLFNREAGLDTGDAGMIIVIFLVMGVRTILALAHAFVGFWSC